MGATNFGTVSVGRFKTVEDAYRAACQEARAYAGHQDGYNGTIDTTNGVRMAIGAPRFNTKAFAEYEQKALDRLAKWGHCLAVEIKGQEFETMKAERGLKGKRGVRAFYFFGWAAI